MKLFTICMLMLTVVCIGAPAFTDDISPVSGSDTEAPMERIGDPMTDASPEESLDDRMGAGTSGRLAAQGPVGYSDNTGLMNVVPSDFEGDIED